MENVIGVRFNLVSIEGGVCMIEKRKMKNEDSVEFSPEYMSKSHVQQRQNQKFLRFIFTTLKSLDIPLESIRRYCEVGVADTEFTKKLEKSFSLEKMILIDKSEYFSTVAIKYLEMASDDVKEGLKYVAIVRDFLEVRVGDRNILGDDLIEGRDFVEKGSIDLFVSSNTFHWFGRRWELAVRKVYEMLSPLGIAFIHQGLKWTYFPLYDLARAILMDRYGIKIDLDDYLYYPCPTEARKKFRDLGFSIANSMCFYEFEGFSSDYGIEELVESFSVAGLLPFLSSLDNKEKEMYKAGFMRAALELRPPVFAHRGFFALRKRLTKKDVKYELLGREGCFCSVDRSRSGEFSRERDYLERRIVEILEEVADDFEPSLRVRLPSTSDFRGLKGKVDRLGVNGGSVIPYANELFSKSCVIVYSFREGLSDDDGEPLGLLAFQVGGDLGFFDVGKKYIYVSTIAVRRRYRGLGLGKVMYQIFLDLVRGRCSRLGLRSVVTRTWSTNERMKIILRDLGFELGKVIENDRGPGVHTEYYVLQLM